MTNAELEQVSKAAARALARDGFTSSQELVLARGVVALLGERDRLLDGVQLALQRLKGPVRLSDETILERWKQALDLATPGWR